MQIKIRAIPRNLGEEKIWLYTNKVHTSLSQNCFQGCCRSTSSTWTDLDVWFYVCIIDYSCIHLPVCDLQLLSGRISNWFYYKLPICTEHFHSLDIVGHITQWRIVYRKSMDHTSLCDEADDMSATWIYWFHQETRFCSNVQWQNWKPVKNLIFTFNAMDHTTMIIFKTAAKYTTVLCYLTRTVILCTIQAMIHELYDRTKILTFELKQGK